MSDGGRARRRSTPIHLLAIEGIGRRKIIRVAENFVPATVRLTGLFLPAGKQRCYHNFPSIHAGAPKSPEVPRYVATIAPGELQPIGMFVDRGDKRVRCRRGCPKVGKTRVFFPASSRPSPDPHRKNLLKAGRNSSAFSCAKINERQIACSLNASCLIIWRAAGSRSLAVKCMIVRKISVRSVPARRRASRHAIRARSSRTRSQTKPSCNGADSEFGSRKAGHAENHPVPSALAHVVRSRQWRANNKVLNRAAPNSMRA